MTRHTKQWFAFGTFFVGMGACGTTNFPEKVSRPVFTPTAVVPSLPAPVRVVNAESRLVGGASQTCVIQTNGHFSCWGRSAAALSSTPVAVNDQPVKAIAFYQNALFVTNGDGQILESSALAPFNKPVTFTLRPDLAAIKALSCSGGDCCGIEEGHVVCWGSSSDITQGKDTEKEPKKRIAIEGIPDPIAVSENFDHACALTSAGTVWCWGKNGYSQLGTSDRAAGSKAPVEVKGLTDVVEVVVDYNISCAQTKDGRILCWGSNMYGLVGASGGYESSTPRQITGMPPAQRLRLEHSHACALSNEGEVYCWGSNEYNRLARQKLTESRIPLKIEGLKDVIDISVGMEHVCALHKDETVSCWGNRLEGRLGDGAVSEYPTPVLVPDLNNVVDLCNSEYSWRTCATRANGSEVCWGDNRKMFEKRANGSVACSGDDVLRNDGRVELGDGSVVTGLEQAIQFSTDRSAGCGMRQDGVVLCWKQGEVAKIVFRDAKVLAFSDRAACAVKNDGTLWCWREVARRSAGATQPIAAFGVRDVVDVSMNLEGEFPSGCVVHTDGTVECWYWDLAIMENNHLELRRKAKVGVTGAVLVDGGAEDGCAVLADGRVQCWGSNEHGELGDGTTEKRKEPVFVKGLSNVSRVLVSTRHRCALHRDGNVSCWGDNSKWDVGIPFEKTSWKPVQVKGLGPKK